MIELRHLKTLHALREHGSLVSAAEYLCVTPSALSHQLKELEQQLELAVLNRKTKPLQFTTAGQRLLVLADQILPEVAQVQRDLKRLAHGQTGTLRLASECHSCFDWLMPVLNQYRQDWPDVELDFVSGFEPQPHLALQQGETDILITSDCIALQGLSYQKLFEYESRLVLAPDHPLARQSTFTAEQVAAETLIAYPVEPERLDLIAGWLAPQKQYPAQLRTTELTPMLIQLVASGRGIAALPDWVVSDYERKGWVVSRRLPTNMATGLIRSLYVGFRHDAPNATYLAAFIDVLIKMTTQRTKVD
ncbi:MAG: LysR family transcriptional regulator [Pseudomonadota bacterium]|nr:LysR family transcriptional regulator [Pseudomonadota bacterium]